jgi:hypothetical protein
MVFIKADIEVIIKVADDTTSYRNTHPEDVDKDVELVLEQITNGDEKVVF